MNFKNFRPGNCIGRLVTRVEWYLANVLLPGKGTTSGLAEKIFSEKVIRSLGKAGIPAAKIGEIAQKEQGVKIRSEQRLKDVPMFARDEIARILEKA